jgi:hypothetical protein
MPTDEMSCLRMYVNGEMVEAVGSCGWETELLIIGI